MFINKFNDAPIYLINDSRYCIDCNWQVSIVFICSDKVIYKNAAYTGRKKTSYG